MSGSENSSGAGGKLGQVEDEKRDAYKLAFDEAVRGLALEIVAWTFDIATRG